MSLGNGDLADQAQKGAEEVACDRKWIDLDAQDLAVGTGREIGFEFARLGLKLAEDVPDSVREGYSEGRYAHKRGADESTKYERKLVRLKLSAFRRGRGVDQNVTAQFLQKIEVKYCPITRIEMTSGTAEETDATVDRVFNGAAYAVGNIAMMSMKANKAKGSLLPKEILELAARGEARGGLSEIEWMRLGCLTAMAAPKGYGSVVLPMYVYPPKALLLSNVHTLIQMATSMMAAGYERERWSAEMRSQLTGKKTKSKYDEYMEALSARAARELRGVVEMEQVHFALCDCWTNELVATRYQELAQRTSKEDVLRMAGVAKKTLGGMRRISDEEMDGWSLESRGYEHV